jgi:hypothetical protein
MGGTLYLYTQVDQNMDGTPMFWISAGVSPADDLGIKKWRDAHATSNPDFTLR